MKYNFKKLLGRKLLVLSLCWMTPQMLSAASDAGGNWQSVEIKLNDKRALQSGAGLFVNYCLSCHSAKYMRYNRLAADLEIDPNLVMDNMIFSAAKIGDPMTVTMSPQDAKEWFGVAPPDLTLVARLRGAEWLYNYLHGFYLDAASTTGWNNTRFENVAMPHVLAELQGTRRAVFKTVTDAAGVQHKAFEKFETVAAGRMDAAEYDRVVSDLTHFLVYMGEPARLVRIHYGIGVLLFLAVFASLAYCLKKDYWRDIS